MLTPLDLEAGIKNQKLTLAKDLENIISYRLFSYFETLEPINMDEVRPF